jgi:hypothetical protein
MELIKEWELEFITNQQMRAEREKASRGDGRP